MIRKTILFIICILLAQHSFPQSVVTIKDTAWNSFVQEKNHYNKCKKKYKLYDHFDTGLIYGNQCSPYFWDGSSWVIMIDESQPNYGRYSHEDMIQIPDSCIGTIIIQMGIATTLERVAFKLTKKIAVGDTIRFNILYGFRSNWYAGDRYNDKPYGAFTGKKKNSIRGVQSLIWYFPGLDEENPWREFKGEFIATKKHKGHDWLYIMIPKSGGDLALMKPSANFKGYLEYLKKSATGILDTVVKKDTSEYMLGFSKEEKSYNRYDTVNIITLPSLFFKSNDTIPMDIKQEELEALCKYLQKNKIGVVVHGYTDDVGSEYSNYKLSVSRARWVRGYLINCGISASRISIIGHGENNQSISNINEEIRKRDRRVEIELIRD